MNCNECYAVFYSEDCTNCRDCKFCQNCIGCSDCFGCTNLQGQKYCIFNEKLDKTTYISRLQSLRITHNNLSQIRAKTDSFHATQPVRYSHNIHSENVIGDYLFNSRNVIGFEVFECENTYFVDSSKYTKDSMDVNGYGYYSDHLLESLGSGNASMAAFTACCEFSHDLYYSSWCQNSHHLFGCVGVRHGEYSLLNRALGQHEYETLVPRVIDHMISTGEWGEFFDASLSPFGYNETIGADSQPLDRMTVEKYGWRWYDIPKKDRTGSYVVPLDTAEYHPEKTTRDIAAQNIETLLAGIIQCEKSGEPFRILREELKFYITHDLPIPRLHPQVRYNERIAFMNRKELKSAQCGSC